MCLAQLLGLRMNRIQFTSDLLPADILGTHIYDPKKSEFQFYPGPIFAEIVLGDELNRASPKSQSAFLQAMEEKQVTIDGKSYDLPELFFIIATQNPQTQVGTSALPESQLDRFMMKFALGFPDRNSELKILSQGNPRDKLESLKPLFTADELMNLQKSAMAVSVSEPLLEYIQDLLSLSRSVGSGLSPRAGLQLLQAAKAWTYIHGRDFVLPDDVQAMARPVLNHRLGSDSMGVDNLLKSVVVK